jgi:L-threonylcarbamoyladenylate synthase
VAETKILSVSPTDPDPGAIEQAAEVLRKGGLVAFPTETVYGLGADVLNLEAIRHVFEVKGRPSDNPLIVHVAGTKQLDDIVDEIPDKGKTLGEAFWPGPLTLVFAASERVPPELTQGTGAIGIRIPSSVVCLKLVSHVGAPLTSTSANMSGAKPARTIRETQGGLKGIDMFLDAGELPESPPSTIVDVSGAVPRVSRRGVIPIEDLRHIVACIET